MKILLVGGGSGGHVTPLRALAEVLEKQPNNQLTVVTDRSFYVQTAKVFNDMPAVRLRRIYSGKYRRYHHRSLLWHLTHLPTLLKNLGDIFLLFIGTLQAILYMLVNRPSVVFAKGGFVSLPVGVAARLLGVRLIIHDSDSRPGITSRILSRWAATIATGMPMAHYPYPKQKMIHVGMPVHAGFQPVTAKRQQSIKATLGLSKERPLLLAVGGGTGAVRLNNKVAKLAPGLIEAGWQVVQLTGVGKAEAILHVRDSAGKDLQAHWLVEEFVETVPYVQAADIIISRAGASALQEFANAKKPVIVVPAPQLADQVKNAHLFAKAGSVIVLEEATLDEQAGLLLEAIQSLAANRFAKAHRLAETLHAAFAKPDAAQKLAEIIVGGKAIHKR